MSRRSAISALALTALVGIAFVPATASAAFHLAPGGFHPSTTIGPNNMGRGTGLRPYARGSVTTGQHYQANAAQNAIWNLYDFHRAHNAKTQ